jgi:hypothetical protein
VSPVARRFSELIFQAMESPEAVNRSDLLTAASNLLDALLMAAGGPGVPLARRMCCLALDWCCFDRPEDYARLLRAAELFGMHTVIAERW